MYIFEDPILLFIALGLKGHILITLNLDLIFFFVKDYLLYSFSHGYFFWFHVIAVKHNYICDLSKYCFK
jgi:hypothetical protein